MIYIALPRRNNGDKLIAVDGCDLRTIDGALEILNHIGKTDWIIAPGEWKFATVNKVESAYL